MFVWNYLYWFVKEYENVQIRSCLKDYHFHHLTPWKLYKKVIKIMTSIIQSRVDYEGDAYSDEQTTIKVLDLYKYSF